MTHPHHDRLLAYAAERAKARPGFLAWVLARYIEVEQVSEGELQQRLGVTARDLPHLALCLRPRPEHFAADVRQISMRFHINPAALAKVVRLVESVEALAAENAGGRPTDAGLLMAARARQQPPADVPEGHDHDHPGS